MGCDAKALAACDRAVKTDGSPQLAHTLRGNILSGAGRDADALAAYDRAIELDMCS